jgi:hypothetical protein
LPIILRFFGQTLGDAGFNFLWPLVAVTAAGLLATRGQRPALPPSLPLWMPLLVSPGYLAAMALAFLFSDYRPLEQHLLTTTGRLASHVAPALIIWLGWLASPERPADAGAPGAG